MTIEFKVTFFGLVVLALALAILGPARPNQDKRREPREIPRPAPRPNAGRRVHGATHFPPNTDPDVVETISKFDRQAREAASAAYHKAKASFAAAREAREARA